MVAAFPHLCVQSTPRQCRLVDKDSRCKETESGDALRRQKSRVNHDGGAGGVPGGNHLCVLSAIEDE